MFTDHARWLLDWHNKRSDSFATRSVALLGFTGVILALLARGLEPPEGVEGTLGIRVGLVATTGLLLATALCCLVALSTSKTSFVSIQEIRGQWRDWAQAARRGGTHGQIAKSLLHSTRFGQDSPLDRAKKEADLRGGWLTAATWFLLIALIGLTALVLQIFWQL